MSGLARTEMPSQSAQRELTPLNTRETSKRTRDQECKPTVGVVPHAFIERVSALRVDELVTLLTPLTEKIFVISDAYDDARGAAEIIPIKATKRAVSYTH